MPKIHPNSKMTMHQIEGEIKMLKQHGACSGAIAIHLNKMGALIVSFEDGCPERLSWEDVVKIKTIIKRKNRMIKLHKESLLTANQICKIFNDSGEMGRSSEETVDVLNKRGARILKDGHCKMFDVVDLERLVREDIDDSELGLQAPVDLARRRFRKAVPEDQHEILLSFLAKCESIIFRTKSGMTMSLTKEPKTMVIALIRPLLIEKPAESSDQA